MITPKQIENLKILLESGADADFFFTSIKSSEWLPVLLKNGFFDSPPEPEHGDNWVRFPPWPQSSYLVRAAPQIPEEVVKAALHIPFTKNASVNNDILRVALAVAPPLASKLLPRISQWAKQTNPHWMTIDVAKLITHISNGGNFKGAINLLRSLIDFSTDPEKAEKEKIRKTGSIYGWGLEPHNPLEAQDYKELLDTTIPTLVKRDPMVTLFMLASVLNKYIYKKISSGTKLNQDDSHSWRPSIAESDQNPDYNQISHLISILRETGESAVNGGLINIEQLLSVARKYNWDIFKRFELHWARIFYTQLDHNTLRCLLLTPDYFFSGNFDLEYGLLLGHAFKILEPNEKIHIFEWIEQGPQAHDLAWMGRTLSGEPATKELIDQRIAYWRVSRLFWIKNELDPTWRKRYDHWVKESHEPEKPGFRAWSGGIEVGVRSPLAVEALHAMTLRQQIEFLKSWKPETPSWRGAMKEGLAGTFQIEVKTHAVHYFENIKQFIEIDPAYISAAIRGLQEGLKQQTISSWEPFWTFALWILNQPDPETEIEDELTGRKHMGRRWQSCRLEIIRFVLAIIKNELTRLPMSERASIWQLIEILTHDPSPTVADEVRDGMSIMDPFTLSLNTVRGEAVHAVFSYISWARSNRTNDSQSSQTLDDVPEARSTLESLLNPQIEPSLTVRSIFGANVVPLTIMAEKWLVEHLGEIFPREGHDRLWEIAWDTFISFSHPNARTLSILHSEYTKAIKRMPQDSKVAPKRQVDPRVSLGQHLIANYWWGYLDFEKPDDLLAEFYALATEKVRAQIMSYIGRSIAQTAESISPEIFIRLEKFWNWRVAQAIAANGMGFKEEMAEFAWWFNAKKLGDDWTTKQMIVSLELSHTTKNQFLWMKHFAEIAKQYPRESIRALELTLVAVQQKAAQFWNEDEATEIFKAVANIEDPPIRQHALRAQDLLLRMGRRQFLHVLPAAK